MLSAGLLFTFAGITVLKATLSLVGLFAGGWAALQAA